MRLPAFVTQRKVKRLSETYARDLVESLDLVEIRKRVRKENPSWNKKRLDEAERRYRGFLFVCSQFKEISVPDVDLDEFWHAHILYTKKYMEDCNGLFGRYLHHNPE